MGDDIQPGKIEWWRWVMAFTLSGALLYIEAVMLPEGRDLPVFAWGLPALFIKLDFMDFFNKTKK